MISVFTPVHKTSAPFLLDAYKGMMSQTYTDWEWVICLNNGGYIDEAIKDPRIKVISIEDVEHYSIGRLKKFCCDNAKGEILVELDADDILTPDALGSILAAFQDEKVQMVYSNSAAFDDGTWKASTFSEYWGWRSRPFIFEGHPLLETIAWEPSVQMMRRIEWAPDHVRCWRTSAYKELGGHDPEIKAGDDHDLCCRTYLTYGQAGFKHIDQCLYLYRLHPFNSSKTYNADVQAQTDKNYCKYSRDMATKWAFDNGLRCLDLGGQFNKWDHYETVDLMNADIIMDLDEEHWNLPDNSVGVIKAYHIFEHLKDPINAMNEAFRVLAPGGFLFIEVPSADGRGAFQDPTHKSFWNQNSIWYYTDQNFARFIQPRYKGKFQKARVATFYPGQFEKDNEIPYLQADLICLKAPYTNRPVGEVLI